MEPGALLTKIPPFIKNQAVNLQNKSNMNGGTVFLFSCCVDFLV